MLLRLLRKAWKVAKAGNLGVVHTQGPDVKIRAAGERAISQSDSRIQNSRQLKKKIVNIPTLPSLTNNNWFIHFT